MIIVGDYNLPGVTKKYHHNLDVEYFPGTSQRIKAKVLPILGIFSFLGMNQYFPINDGKGYTLDLAVSTLCLEPVQALDFLQPQSAHHDPGLLMLDNYLVTVTKLSSDHTCLGVLV